MWRNRIAIDPSSLDTGQARHLFESFPAFYLPVPPMLACTVPLSGIKAKKIPIVQPNLTF
jgi:hypothetical protein